MRNRSSRVFAISGVALAALTGVACGGGGATAIPPNVSPTPDNVLTCDTLQLSVAGGHGTGTWTLSPASAGTISNNGLYTAPTIAPASPGVTVTYTDSTSAQGTAQLQVAEMFVGAAAPLPVDAMTETLVHNSLEHELTAGGAHVYAGLIVPGSSTTGSAVDVYASANYGATFTGPTAYATGGSICGTVAIDAGDPSVVYLVYLAYNVGTMGGQTLRLAVSTDGAKSFPTEYDLAEGYSNLSSFICPDVISPSASHVVVSAYSSLVPDGSKDHVATWASSNQGADIGPASQAGMVTSNEGCDCELGNDTNATPVPSCSVFSDGGFGGPRLIANGAGNVCVVYQYGSCADATKAYNVAVQCSGDSGATWSTVTLLGVPDTDNSVVPVGAISPGGKIAVAWVGPAPASAGGGSATYVAVSSDGGKTFSTPVADASAVVGSPASPVLSWENDMVLWLSQITTDNAENLYVDKSCDDGATWAGPVQVGTNGVRGAALVLTGKGEMTFAADSKSVTTFSLGGQ